MQQQELLEENLATRIQRILGNLAYLFGNKLAQLLLNCTYAFDIVSMFICGWTEQCQVMV